jgi:hypothetical protein
VFSVREEGLTVSLIRRLKGGRKRRPTPPAFPHYYWLDGNRCRLDGLEKALKSNPQR